MPMRTDPVRDEVTLRQFLDMVYGDLELVAAEFDAIVAVGYGNRRTHVPTPVHAGTAGTPATAGRVQGPLSTGFARPARPGVDSEARERSPPWASADGRRRCAGRQVHAAHPAPRRDDAA